MRRKTFVFLVLLLAAGAAAHAIAGAPLALAGPAGSEARSVGTPSGGFGRAPSLIGTVASLFSASGTDPLNLCPLRQSDGWRASRLVLADRGTGVYLGVKGKAQFETAEILYSDGSRERIDLAGCVRAGGLYELAAFAVERDVAAVDLWARAVSKEAQVSVLLGR